MTTDSSFASYLPEAKSLVGVLFAVFGNIMISAAINIQKYAHNKLQAQAPPPSPAAKPMITANGEILMSAPALPSETAQYAVGEDSDDEDGDAKPAALDARFSLGGGERVSREDLRSEPAIADGRDLPPAPPYERDASAGSSAPGTPDFRPRMQRPTGEQHIKSIYPPPPVAASVAAAEAPPPAVDSSRTGDPAAAAAPGRAAAGESLTKALPAVEKYAPKAPPGTARKEENATLGVGRPPVDDYGEKEDDEIGEEESSENGGSHYLKSKYWWAGMILMVSGEVGNFVAYGYAPASVVAPLGTVALISNAVLAPLMLKEVFRARDFIGVCCAIFGAVVVVISSKAEETQLSPDALSSAALQPKFIAYTVFLALGAVGLVYLSDRVGDRLVVVDLGLVAIFGGYTVMSTKAISSLIGANFLQMFSYPITYLSLFVLISTAILQIKYLNKALQRFDSTQVIPTQFVLFTIAAIAGGGVLYNDFDKMTPYAALSFVCGCCMTFLGVYFITSLRTSKTGSAAAAAGAGGTKQSLSLKGSRIGSIRSTSGNVMFAFDGRRRPSGHSQEQRQAGEYELRGWGSVAGDVLDDDEELTSGGGYYGHPGNRVGGRLASSSHHQLFDYHDRRQSTGYAALQPAFGDPDSIFAQRGAIFWGSVRRASQQARDLWLTAVHRRDGAPHSASSAGRLHKVRAASFAGSQGGRRASSRRQSGFDSVG